MDRVETIAELVWVIMAAGILATGCGSGPGEATPPTVTRTAVEPTPTPSPRGAVATEPSSPTVSISPRSGPPGSQVDVMVAGFPPESKIEIGVGRVNSEYDVMSRAKTNSVGRLDMHIALPGFVDPADRWVIVAATEDGAVRAISDEFEVTQAASPTPSEEDVLTRTNIYLIAVGDEGENGEPVGCGDSVVPVEIVISPTVAPLRPALDELLAIETKDYGQSGLYNALSRSDLAVESVAIEGEEAVIELTGTLSLGGVCDEPRVRAQLEETALQYPTVDEVSVLVNGTPLDELLSNR